MLSRASAHGRLQFKLKKLRVGGYMEKELKWFNYLRARTHPGCEVSYQCVPNPLASLLRPCFVEASPTVEKAISCYKADRLVALLPIFRTVRLSLANFVLQGRTLWMRPRTGVCEDVVVPKEHQNNRNYVSSVDLPSDSLCKILAWWAVTQRTSKNHKAVKIRGWALARVWALVWTIQYIILGESESIHSGNALV